MPTSAVTRRPFVIASVMLSMFMVAIEATIVSTAMPQIVGQLGGLALYSWVFSSFLLTQTVATVIFGKLSDVYGRRPTLLAGIAIFLAGSLACGFAWSMPSLIAFRLVQGLGAGAIQPIALTIVGDLYSAEERGRIQGVLASVWAVSAVLGPIVGAVIIEHASWALIFWMNLPVGVLACAGFILFLQEERESREPVIDVAGAALFTVAMGALMVALTEFGNSNPGQAGAATAVFGVAAVLFSWQERRAPEPMISFELWGRRPIAASNAAALLAAMALIGLTTFLPIYVQGVLRQTPVVAGLALTVMVLGWPLGATVAARSFVRVGLRPILLAGSALLPAGALLFLLLTPESPPALAGAGSLVMGLGMGLLTTASIVLVQEIVPWSERGSTTASNVFSRNLGSTLGATIFGAVLNYGLSRSGAGVATEDLRALLAGGDAAATLGGARLVLQSALHHTFWAVFAISVATVAASLFVPYVPLGRRVQNPAE